ncbi:MAG: AI-2E family transporter [Betaproteobacteria bacterium HGW-Betaproteobacteria-9]|nr:MAG: AI-2E family transporter [Betaproteobacteria bacterium HGW-Betaproteobacteria-9]
MTQTAPRPALPLENAPMNTRTELPLPSLMPAPPARIGYFRPMILVLFLGALVLLAFRLSDLLLMLFGAVIVAVALRALAQPLGRYLRLSPRLAVALAVSLAVVVIVLGSWLVGDRLVAQFDDLARKLPKALSTLISWARERTIGEALWKVWRGTNADDVPWASVAVAATQALSAVGGIGLVLVVGVYLAADPVLYREGLVRLVPPAYRGRVGDALLASGHALSRWLLGQGISMLFVGTSTAIGLALLGLPLALTLGLLAGALAFIPFFGPIASGVLAVLLAFMQGPELALYVAILCVVIQQIEGNLLMPLVQRWAVELPPVLGITAAVIFGLLFGLPGVILASPLMVVAMVLVRMLYVEGVLEAQGRIEQGGEPVRSLV